MNLNRTWLYMDVSKSKKEKIYIVYVYTNIYVCVTLCDSDLIYGRIGLDWSGKI